MLTRAPSVEWAKYNINVNATAPTYTKTAILHSDPEIEAEMVRDMRMGRLGEPGDLKVAVVCLAADASDFVTGHTILVDGGYAAW